MPAQYSQPMRVFYTTCHHEAPPAAVPRVCRIDTSSNPRIAYIISVGSCLTCDFEQTLERSNETKASFNQRIADIRSDYRYRGHVVRNDRDRIEILHSGAAEIDYQEQRMMQIVGEIWSKFARFWQAAKDPREPQVRSKEGWVRLRSLIYPWTLEGQAFQEGLRCRGLMVMVEARWWEWSGIRSERREGIYLDEASKDDEIKNRSFLG